jgi:large subunit ribosomal protein L29
MAAGLTAQLRVSTEEELQSKLAEAKEELFNLRFQGATGQLESHGRLRAVKKEIARIYTVMRERELGIITLIEDSGEPEPADETPAAAPAARKSRSKAKAADDDVAEEAGK